MIKTKYTKLYLLAFFTTVFAWYSYASSPCWTLSNCLTEIRSNDSWYIGYILWEVFDSNAKVKTDYLFSATTSQAWIVTLENSTWSTSQYTVPTSAILKSVWDNLNTRLNAVSTDLYGSYVNLTSEQNISWEKNFLNNMWIGWVKSSNTRLVVKWTWTGSTSYWLNVIDSLNNSLFLVRDDWKVGIWTTAPYGPLEVRWLSPADTGWHAWILNVVNSAPMQSWIGWTIHLYGNYMNTTPSTAVFAEIAGIKENWTSGDSKWVLTFSTRAWASLPDEKMRITSNGNVGIWTTIPSDILTLKSNNPRIRMDDSDTLNNWRITLDNNAIRIESDVDNLTSDSLIAFLVDNSIKMVIKDSWNVGIGTSNPLYTLDVLKSAWNASIRAKSDGIDSVSSIYIQNDSKSYAIQTDWWNNDKLIFYDNTAWSSRMVIDSFWNIWIWTINPTYWLDLLGSTDTKSVISVKHISWAQTILQWHPNYWSVGTATNSPFRIVTNDVERVRIDTSGNIWIWITSPSTLLHLHKDNPNGIWPTLTLSNNYGYGGSDVLINLKAWGNDTFIRGVTPEWVTWTAGSSLAFYTTPSGSVNGGWYSVERMRILNNWYVWIWTTTPWYKLDVNWTIRWYWITDSSDIRLKKDIKKIWSTLDNVMKIQWVTYKWKDENISKDEQIWIIAQDLEKVYPDLVSTDERWFKSVNYSHLTIPLLEAIKELKEEKDKEIQELKKEIQKLKQ